MRTQEQHEKDLKLVREGTFQSENYAQSAQLRLLIDAIEQLQDKLEILGDKEWDEAPDSGQVGAYITAMTKVELYEIFSDDLTRILNTYCGKNDEVESD